jgi:hypothetical protein
VRALEQDIYANNTAALAIPVKVEVPRLTQRVMVDSYVFNYYDVNATVDALASPDNFFLHHNLHEFHGRHVAWTLNSSWSHNAIEYPTPGPLYLSFVVSNMTLFFYNVTLVPCEYDECDGIELNELDHTKSYESEAWADVGYVESAISDGTNRTQVFHKEILTEHIGERHGFKLFVPYDQE